MSKNAKRRLVIMICIALVCALTLVVAGIHREDMEPSAYNYYIRNITEEAGMSNAVTAIYLRYRLFDTLFEALLLAVAVSAVMYFAAAWEKEKGDHGDE